MTPKEKAKELVDKMHSQMPVKVIPIASTRENQLSCNIDLKGSLKNAKQCSLIAVNEIIINMNDLEENGKLKEGFGLELQFWLEVKNEINKQD